MCREKGLNYYQQILVLVAMKRALHTADTLGCLQTVEDCALPVGLLACLEKSF